MITIRRVLTHVEDIHHEFGPPAETPMRRGAIAAVLTNPDAGRYEPDLPPMMDALTPVGADLAHRLRDAMDIDVDAIGSDGKGAIIGSAGELEHGASWHLPVALRCASWSDGRAAVRLGRRVAWSSARAERRIEQRRRSRSSRPPRKSAGPARCSTCRSRTSTRRTSAATSMRSRSRCRAPLAADELVVILAAASGPRIHARVGGLAANDVSHWNGLR